MLDSDIKAEYVRFFHYLKESCFVCGEEETLAFMKDLLERYQRTGEGSKCLPGRDGR